MSPEIQGRGPSTCPVHARENRRVLLERSRLRVRRSRPENGRVIVAHPSRPQRPHRVGPHPARSVGREPSSAAFLRHGRFLPQVASSLLLAASSVMRPGLSGSTGFTAGSGISLLPSPEGSRTRICAASKIDGRSKLCSISFHREALRGKSLRRPLAQLRPVPFAVRRPENDDQLGAPPSKIFSEGEFGGSPCVIRSSLPPPRIAALGGGVPGPTSKIVFREPDIGGVRCDLLKVCRPSR